MTETAKVLVVEDKHDVADLIGTYLNLADIPHDIVYTKEDALTYLLQYQYAVILLDGNLGDIDTGDGEDGEEIGQHARQSDLNGDTHIINISADDKINPYADEAIRKIKIVGNVEIFIDKIVQAQQRILAKRRRI